MMLCFFNVNYQAFRQRSMGYKMKFAFFCYETAPICEKHKIVTSGYCAVAVAIVEEGAYFLHHNIVLSNFAVAEVDLHWSTVPLSVKLIKSSHKVSTSDDYVRMIDCNM